MKYKNQLNVLKYEKVFWPHPKLWLDGIENFFRKFKFAWQRITKGYCDYDLYSLDYFYTKLFISSLSEFKEILHSVPVEFYDKENDSVESWENYIQEMVDHFAQYLEDYSTLKNEYDDVFEKYDVVPDAFTKKWLARERELEKERKEELDKGLDMLKERYLDLWD